MSKGNPLSSSSSSSGSALEPGGTGLGEVTTPNKFRALWESLPEERTYSTLALERLLNLQLSLDTITKSDAIELAIIYQNYSEIEDHLVKAYPEIEDRIHLLFGLGRYIVQEGTDNLFVESKKSSYVDNIKLGGLQAEFAMRSKAHEFETVQHRPETASLKAEMLHEVGRCHDLNVLSR